jgi:hypothetical protein
MLFKLLTYIQPTHYFSVLNSHKETVFPIYDSLPEIVKGQLEPDARFKSELAKQYDLSWQAVHKGYIGPSKKHVHMAVLPLEDEYHFLRKYVHAAWVFYVLALRLLRLSNPITELKAWYLTRGTKRSSYLERPLQYADWQTFESPLVKQQPKVTVIIPTLDRYAYLKDVLHDLEQQDYQHFEVIVIDQSEPYQSDFYKSFSLDLHCVYQEEKALWLARNTAIRLSKGGYLLFFDDDSRVAPDWIRMHLKCLDFFKSDLSSGVSISKVGAAVPRHYSFFRLSDQLDTGNVLIKKSVFEAIGLFDRQFEKQRMGDGEFGLRAHMHGFLNVSNPYAQRLHLKVATGGLRAMGSWDAFRTKQWLGPRPIPSVLYFFRGYFGNRAARLALLKSVPMSVIPYRFKAHKGLLVLGVFVSIVISPIIVYQVLKSWRLAGKKLEEGSMIELL